MKRFIVMAANMLAIAAFALIAVSCGDEESKDTAEISSVTVAPYRHTLRKGDTKILTATLLPLNCVKETVAWSSSDPNIATVSSTGEITGEVMGTGVGTAIVTASTSNGKTAACELTVMSIPLAGVTITPESAELVEGQKFQLTVEITTEPPTDYVFVPVWSSGNPAVATVSETGEVTAVSAGTATVTVIVEDLSASVEITVIPVVPLTGFTLSPGSKVTCFSGATIQFEAAPIPANTTEFAPVWTSSNSAVADISETGLLTTHIVGTTTVTVTSGNISKTVEVSVVSSAEGFFHGANAYWQFDDPLDFTKATIGRPLEAAGSGFTAVDGGVRVGIGSYFRAHHGIAANGGGNRVNEYTVLFDYRLTELTGGVWYGLIQTDLSNSGDSDIWIDSSNGRIGCEDRYSGNGAIPIENVNYHRIVVAVKLPEYKIYVDGVLVLNTTIGIDNERRSLDTNGVLFFADASGWDTDIDVSNIIVWDRALSESEVTALGGVE